MNYEQFKYATNLINTLGTFKAYQKLRLEHFDIETYGELSGNLFFKGYRSTTALAKMYGIQGKSMKAILEELEISYVPDTRGHPWYFIEVEQETELEHRVDSLLKSIPEPTPEQERKTTWDLP